MRAIKKVLQLVGSLALVMGVIWIGQGTGHFPYPQQSFMIDQMPWAYRGAGLAAVGLALVLLARRIK